MKLLVVDDSKDITDVVTVYCESKGVECTVVNAGKDGLEVIRDNNEFDLILLWIL
jgi:DNA-binding response OmpR family regulator